MQKLREKEAHFKKNPLVKDKKKINEKIQWMNEWIVNN